MDCKPVYIAGTTPAIQYAKHYLQEQRVPICESPQWDTGHLLLDVPSFRPGSPLCQNKHLDTLLESLPSGIRIWGGSLNHPALEGRNTTDLLQDEQYLAQNAAITAHCAMGMGWEKLLCTWVDLPVLVLGWGRIGKCLAQMLKNMNADITVAVRRPSQKAALSSLGYHSIYYYELHTLLPKFRMIYNTVPEPVLPKDLCDLCPRSIKIDLASRQGIDCENVIIARGLPGIYAPESSGKLIGESFLRLVKEAEA